VASKILTRAQAQSRKAQAVRFAENVLDDPSKADDIESEDLDDWIERKGITLIDNPRRTLEMANVNMSKDELLDYIDELESENSDLQDTLDSIQDLISPAADDTDDDDDDGDDSVSNVADDAY
jgi:hypothetical protein